jgi:hypothetical protein
MSSILDVLRSDYQHFPNDQTFSIYAPDVYFKDPLTEFRGLDRYKQMIGFIEQWFREARLELHAAQQAGHDIRTDWTLSWTTPLPWQPRIAISGWTEIKLNSDELICSHIDYWHCSPWNVLTQHFPFRSAQSI